MTQQDTQPPAETLAERAVMVCPQCQGEGGYPDGVDEAACHTECTRCGGNGWIVDLAALTRRAGGDAIPAGWQLVPVKPTQAMVDNAFNLDSSEQQRRDIWACMLAATPKPPAGGDV